MGIVVNDTRRPLSPRERAGTHWIGRWVGLRADLDGYGNSRPHTGIRSPDRSARSESLYRLRIRKVFWVACSEQVNCVNVFGMGNSNSLTTKSSTCVSVSFLSGIISWSVESRGSGETELPLREWREEYTSINFYDVSQRNVNLKRAEKKNLVPTLCNCTHIK